ncbi:uncharacterized protein LOC113504643 [Trichoplusia ni]|uniref:Uncharacterized protein LOC113504643 n=1 Tax=Trichoplusia ni TaxID=7111 RepID=A0A7E5WRS7_TRINI|nr:uncharacterized protein LOC113504643 [Trichoplusia ni]
MNITRLPVTKKLITYARLIHNVQTIQRHAPGNGYYSTFTIDAFTSAIHDRYRLRFQSNDLKDQSVQKQEEITPKYNVSGMTNLQLDNKFSELLSKNKDKLIEDLVIECQNCRKFLTFATLKKLFRHYSMNGNPVMVAVLQTYCEKVDPVSYRKNGEFLHYLAKAQCIKGNSDKGLAILKGCYKKYDSLRSFYRIIFRELIQDSVLNRSEASLVIFTKYVLEFSKEWSDHYPLVCFWHICWASTWFSDQMLANELLESSTILQNIVRDKATAFSMMALKDYNEDAVVRLLQTLLKYDMMSEYVMVLQVLFNYKLRKRDIRGCSEIIRNCDALGVTLPSDQQGRYIRMLIDNKRWSKEETTRTPSKDFRLKF